MHAGEQEQEPFARISAEEAKRLIDSGAVQAIDVREPAEWNKDHIAQARLVPLGTLLQKPGELTEDGVVFICEVGQRSAVACEFAASMGLEKLYNLEGGMTAWRQQGYPVTQ
jgi:sulfur-carrier protein adenylyltransferase/sulfurtransferase